MTPKIREAIDHLHAVELESREDEDDQAILRNRIARETGALIIDFMCSIEAIPFEDENGVTVFMMDFSDLRVLADKILTNINGKNLSENGATSA